MISFYEVDHTYDRSFVIKYLSELETLLKNIIRKEFKSSLWQLLGLDAAESLTLGCEF